MEGMTARESRRAGGSVDAVEANRAFHRVMKVNKKIWSTMLQIFFPSNGSKATVKY